MKIGLCAWSFTGAHQEAERAIDPHTPAGLIHLAQANDLASVEFAATSLAAHSEEELAVFATSHQGLDLFLDNGETVISAALVEGDLRLPAGSPTEILPPPDLMWGTLGVFRPHQGTRLLGGDRLEGEARRLRYTYDDGTELHYHVTDKLLKSLEIVEGESVVQRVLVDLDGDGGYPVEATYRNLADFRELRLVRESLEIVTPYDPDIWDPLG